MMGCVVVRNEFLKNNKATVDKFLQDYNESITKANQDIDTTATLCETYGIVAKAAVAKKAIPNCNICFIEGKDMKSSISVFYEKLYAANNKSIAAVPDDGFYYER
jgi:NitT/TauT family transport system substrate-binding protein